MGIFDVVLGPIKKKAVDEALQSGDWVQRAQQLGVLAPQSTTPRAMFYDPMSLISQTQYKDRNTALTFDVLRSMAERTEVINAIINTRIAQITSFCQPARWKNKTGLGYQIRFKDAKRKAKPDEERRLAQLEEMFFNCGYTDRYRSGERRPDFGEFVKAILRDSLIFDQMVFEIVPNRAGEPCEWWPIDAATIRMNIPPKGGLDFLEDGRDLEKYVQIYNGVVRHKFSFKELAFCTRNVRSDIRTNGYGFSELEQIINMVTAILWAEEYNKRFFSQGQMINGILNLKGQNVPPDMLEAFRRQWQTLASSVTNAHKVPVLAVKDGVEFVNFHSTNRDMEYSSWIEFLVKIVTAVYLIDPAEVNFDYRGASESAPLFETSPEAKLKHSRDKGLRNLLNFLEQKVNFHLLHEIQNFGGMNGRELYFEFVGIDMKDEQEIVNIRASEVQSYKKVNEVREEAGLEPLSKEDGGDMIANSVIANTILQLKQLDMQSQAGAQQGGEGPQGNPADSVTHTAGFDPEQPYVTAPKGGAGKAPQQGK